MTLKRCWKPLLLLGLIPLLTYLLGTVLTVCWSDWQKSQFSDWPRDLEYTSLFWIGLCMAVPLAQLWILCVSRCVRLFRRRPRRDSAFQNRKAWFVGLSVLLAALIVLNIINGRTYTSLYAAQEPWAKEYATRYYFFVILTEVALGAWIWLALKCAGGKIRFTRKAESQMTVEFLRQCIPLWDTFEALLKRQYIALFFSGSLDKINRVDRGTSKIYDDFGWRYWRMGSGAGARWNARFEEYFFDSRYFSFKRLFYAFPKMDDELEGSVKNLPEPVRKSLASPFDAVRRQAAEECYRLTIAPVLADRKREILEQLQALEAELSLPVPYELTLSLETIILKIPLEFRSRARKKSDCPRGLEGFAYTINGRRYTDVKSLWATDGDELSPSVSLDKDAYGEGVLKTYAQIPTFDAGDREWDSHELSFLMFDGREIHLVVMRGGYRIASLTFYEGLLFADARLKPYFERLGWPTAGVRWTSGCL